MTAALAKARERWGEMKTSEGKKIKCLTCGREHDETTCNCCWIDCECGAVICGSCGSANLVDMDMDEDDDEAQYWCCRECGDCGLTGCAMCI